MRQSDRVDTQKTGLRLCCSHTAKTIFLQSVAGYASYQKIDLKQLLLRELRQSVKILKQIILDCNHLK